MTDWKQIRLGEVIELKRGYDLPQQLRVPGEVPVVSSSGIGGRHNESKVKGPGVVTGRYGTLGQVFYIEEDFWPLNTTLYVRDFKGNDPRFIAYLLETIDFLAYSDKAAVPGVNRNHLHEAIVFIPPVGEQRTIGEALHLLDRKVEVNRRTAETLEAIAQALFQSWFIDFEPVRARMAGESEEEICRRLSLTPELLRLFPDDLDLSEHGATPHGWPVVPMPSAFEINPPRRLPAGVRAPYLEMANVPTRGARALAFIEREVTSGTRFRNGDTLLARITPCLENGKTCFVDFLDEGQVGWGSTEFLVLRPREPLPPAYGYFLARSDALRAHAIANMTGSSGRQRVPASAMDSFFLSIPPAELAHHFGRVADGLLAQMRARDAESSSLAALRDTMLPRLLDGSLALPGA